MDYSKVRNNRDANELTRAYLDSILIESRYLDSGKPDLSLELYGHKFASPVMIAAFSHLHNTRPDGMAEMARGAKAAGICNWAGMGSEEELGRILDTGAETIKIVKPYADRDQVFSMLKYAEEHGAIAVGMDIDHSFSGKGEPDNVLGSVMAPVSTAELREFVQATKLPFIVKGVMSVHDAVKCAEAGVTGVLVSHHHGMMPYALPPLMALPRIHAAVGSSMDLFVDCGINTGADVFKALALGAKAVCVGRCILPALKDEGAQGVVKYVEGMNQELRGFMARTACLNLSRISADILWDAERGEPMHL